MSIPTLAEIKESLPRHLKERSEYMSYNEEARILYGPYARQLTRDTIKRFMGKKLPVITSQDWSSMETVKDRMHEIETIKPLRFDDELDHLWSEWVALWTKERIQDYIYFDGDNAVWGSSMNPIFVFLKGKTSTTKTKSTPSCSSLNGRPRERNVTTGRCKLTKDTTKRFRMKDGKRIAESVPKTKHGRKAPAGHAKGL